MASAGLHEELSDSSDETRDMHRAIVSLMEELEAVDWYIQRVDAATDRIGDADRPHWAKGNAGMSTGITGRQLPIAGKLPLIVAMWVGRLEILPVIMLLTPERRLLARAESLPLVPDLAVIATPPDTVSGIVRVTQEIGSPDET